MDIGARLYALRREKHLSQEEVANLLNVTRQTVSKWETNQSTPDFDKVLPLCELYGMSPNELFGKEEEAMPAPAAENNYSAGNGVPEAPCDEVLQNNADNRRKKAVATAVSVVIYICAVAWLITVIPVFRLNPVVATAVFLVIIAIGVAINVYSGIAYKKQEDKNKPMAKEQKLQKQIGEVLAGIICVIYLLLSFITGAWNITWIVWVVYGVVTQIIKLVFMLKEDKDEE